MTDELMLFLALLAASTVILYLMGLLTNERCGAGIAFPPL
jgi:hypothetical protein